MSIPFALFGLFLLWWFIWRKERKPAREMVQVTAPPTPSEPVRPPRVLRPGSGRPQWIGPVTAIVVIALAILAVVLLYSHGTLGTPSRTLQFPSSTVIAPAATKTEAPQGTLQQPTMATLDEYWKIPSDTLPREQWLKVVVAPGKTSPHIAAPSFTPIHYETEDGTRLDYEVYTYYAEQSHLDDCLLVPEAQCPSGWKGIYFKDKSNDHSITMSYATHSG